MIDYLLDIATFMLVVVVANLLHIAVGWDTGSMIGGSALILALRANSRSRALAHIEEEHLTSTKGIVKVIDRMLDRENARFGR